MNIGRSTCRLATRAFIILKEVLTPKSLSISEFFKSSVQASVATTDCSLCFAGNQQGK